MHQNDNQKKVDKATQIKTGHKSKPGVISTRFFQANRRAVPISCHEQKALMQGWPDLTPALVEHDNRSEQLDCRSGNVGTETPPNVDE